MPLDGEPFKGPDFKKPPRVKNKGVARSVHSAGCFCVLNCGLPGEAHHVLFKSQGGDDDPANMVCMCQVHHSHIHAEDAETKKLLGEYLLRERPDTVRYVSEKGGTDWISRRLFGVK